MLLAFTTDGGERRIGLVDSQDDEQVVDLNAAYAHYLAEVEDEVPAAELADVALPADLRAFLEGGQTSRRALRAVSNAIGSDLEVDADTTDPAGRAVCHDRDDVSLRAPLPRPHKLLELLMAYPETDDTEEAGAIVDQDEVIFVPSGYHESIVGPGDRIVYPEESNQVLPQIELGVVIGKEAFHVSEDEARDHIAGYTICNDVNAVDVGVQRNEGLSRFRGDSFPTFMPTGPGVVLKEDIDDPEDLDVTCRLNGEVKQEYNTSENRYDLEQIVSHISQSLVLKPGDTISTGVAHEGLLECEVSPGDTIEGEIEGIGTISNEVISESEADYRYY